MATNNLTFFPAQKKSTSQKNKKWMQDCVDSADEFTNIREHRIRQSQYNKKVNYDLYNDILDQRDIERITNPYNIRNASFPAKMQNYPIVNPKIDLLVGEEFKRRFDWRVMGKAIAIDGPSASADLRYLSTGIRIRLLLVFQA